MTDAAPNFRLTVRFDEDEPSSTTLRTFLEENEGAPDVCTVVAKLAPGEQATFGGGAAPLCVVTRAPKTSNRFTRIRVPIKRFNGAEFATVVIDRKRLTIAIRPARRRVALELELSDWVERMLWKAVAATARQSTRRPRRARRSA